MADFNLDIVIKAHDQATAIFNRAQSSAEKFGARIQASVSNFVSFRAAAIAGTAALAGFTYAMVTSIKAAGEAEAAEKKLAVALGYTSEALLEQAGALQRVTTFGDDQIVGAQALIAAFTKDESHIKSLTKATLDLATAKGMDLSSAAELVGKTFGTSTNAMARQGIVVDATAGSAERLSQILNGLSRYNGQAEGAAQTFEGRLLQLKNTFGDLQEEIGFVITKNSVFIKAVELARGVLERMATWVKNNRLELMSLAQGAMIAVIRGIGSVVTVLEFFHNGWLGLRLVAQVVLFAVALAVESLYRALRAVLYPLDLIFAGMKKLGLNESNPFDNWQESLTSFKNAMGEPMKIILDQADDAGKKYSFIRGEISKIASEMGKWKAAEVDAGKKPKDDTSGDGDGLGDKTVRSAADEEAAQSKRAQSRLDAMGTAPGMIGGPDAPEQLAEAVQMAERMKQQEDFYARKAVLATAAGEGEAAVNLIKNQSIEAQDRQSHQLRLSTAQGAFGMMSNMMQNLTALSGKEGGTAFKAMKAFAIAETAIQTYRAAMGSYAALAPIPIVGPFLGAAAAAAATIAGLARIKQIQSMEPGGSASGSTVSAGGSANPSYSGGSPSAYPSPQQVEEKQAQNITVIINNPLADENWDRIVQDNIVPAINAAGERNVKISLRAVEAN